MLAKIVTNTTGTAIELTRIGVTLQPATPYTIQPALFPFWAQYSGIGSQVAALVTSGDVTVSDGLTPILNAVLGLELLRNLLARNVAFDNRMNGFAATNVQAAIEEIVTSTVNFSFRIVAPGVTITIPYEQQMLTYQDITVDDTGQLIINGELVILE